jgi:chromosome segregation ATPase
MQDHQDRERMLLKTKEQIKFQKMEMELVNSQKVAEIRQQHEKQLVKLRQQFEDGLSELYSRSESRLGQLESDLELRRRVEIHEVEERKNQHINDLIKNHKKAFGQMKSYYNEITAGNLQLIKSLQKQVEELKDRSLNNKRLLIDYGQENVRLSKPLQEVTNDIAEVQAHLKERAKDQMALRNAHARLSALTKASAAVKNQFKSLQSDYQKIELERDQLYSSFEDTLTKVHQQSEFHNQVLEQRLRNLENNAEKSAVQVEEIIRAANLDSNEMARVVVSLNQMLSAKDDALRQVSFTVLRLQKTFNDSLDTVTAKFKELGISEHEVQDMNFKHEVLPIGSTSGPAGLLTSIL